MKIIRFIVISFLSYLFISHLARVTPRQPSKQTASTRRTVGNRCFRVPGIWLMFVFAGLAQLVEQLICNQSVIGSSPISSSRRYPLDEDITQKSTKTIPLRLERAVTQYGDFQFA